MRTNQAIVLIVRFAFALLFIAGVAWLVLPDKPSVVRLHNTGTEAITLSVTTTNPSAYSWQGTLQPGEQVSRTASFGDNSFQIDCRDSKGRSRRQYGYVTSGLTFVITMAVNSCADITYDARRIP